MECAAPGLTQIHLLLLPSPPRISCPLRSTRDKRLLELLTSADSSQASAPAATLFIALSVRGLWDWLFFGGLDETRHREQQGPPWTRRLSNICPHHSALLLELGQLITAARRRLLLRLLLLDEAAAPHESLEAGGELSCSSVSSLHRPALRAAVSSVFRESVVTPGWEAFDFQLRPQPTRWSHSVRPRPESTSPQRCCVGVVSSEASLFPSPLLFRVFSS
ncbi:unnamed protein product [Pleuronectes platessa]|uniref:Uncharacterized protein n=1 Tax=Pleuronectes platessa TaxID=8262 RepID=A0A9N7YD04_PLEPL|nr:unnamed protein product [Pleuronectes platessa]